MPVREEAMTAEQFERARRRLDLSVDEFADALGISRRQVFRYSPEAKGGQPVPPPVAKLIKMYLKFGVPK
jgi:DNA-binding transcriptional regulator YiaG